MPATRQKPMVIYDGSCGICAGNLKWLVRLDHLKIFDSMPYQAEDLETRYPQVRRSDCEKTLHVVLSNGRVYQGSDGFRAVFLRMPLMFLVGLLMWIPPVAWLLRKLYPILARNRYKLGGHCELPKKR